MRLQLCSQSITSTKSIKHSVENVVPANHTSSDSDNNDYSTADEGECTSIANNVPETSSTTDLHKACHDQVSHTLPDETSSWIHVKSHKDLPKINSTVTCIFPNYNGEVKCNILSKAGKSSTKNWHYMNIQEDREDGKCCSFKDASWKVLLNQDPALHVQQTSYRVFNGSYDSAFDID